MEDATSSPGRTRAASPATRSRPGPTTVKGIKAKMPRWRAVRRGVHRNAPHRPEQSGQPARSNPVNAPCRRADPLAQSSKQGPIFFLLNVTHVIEQSYAKEWLEMGGDVPQSS